MITLCYVEFFNLVCTNSYAPRGIQKKNKVEREGQSTPTLSILVYKDKLITFEFFFFLWVGVFILKTIYLMRVIVPSPKKSYIVNLLQLFYLQKTFVCDVYVVTRYQLYRCCLHWGNNLSFNSYFLAAKQFYNLNSLSVYR